MLEKNGPKFEIKVDKVVLSDKAEEIKALQLELANLNRKSFTVLLPSEKNSLLKERKQTIRRHIQELQEVMTAYAVTISTGRHRYVQALSKFPTSEDLKWLKESLMSEIKEYRTSIRSNTIESKNFQGFSYDTIGNVFTEKGTILKLLSQCDPMTRINHNKVPAAKSKANYIGIEFEFGSGIGKEEVKKKLCNARLAGLSYVKYDSSLRVKEGHSQHEVTFLTREQDRVRNIYRMCKVLRDQCEGYVNSSCGLHIHLDMRNRDHKLVYWNLVMALPVLTKIVPKSRIGNRYCAVNSDPDYDTAPTTKYTAINKATMSAIKTIEVRLHSGSLNPRKISNFVDVLLSIVNMKERVQDTVDSIDKFQSVFGISNSLTEFMKERELKFQDGRFDTDQDFGEDLNEEIQIAI